MLRGHRDLKVYQLAYKLAMEIFHLSKAFPKEEIYSLTDQIRRSSRSVAANMAEGFRKRRISSASSQTATQRRPRRKFGSISLSTADIYRVRITTISQKDMKKLGECFLG